MINYNIINVKFLAKVSLIYRVTIHKLIALKYIVKYF